MLLRWLHKIWTWFWTVVLGAVLLVLVLGAVGFGILQLDATRGWIVDRLERDFDNAFRSELTIGSMQGLLPFRARLDNVLVRYPAGAGGDTLVSIDRVSVNLDPWSLLRKQISITGFAVDTPRVRMLTDSLGRYTLAEAFRPVHVPDEGRPVGGEGDSTASGVPEGDSGDSWFRGIEIIAPSVTVREGSIHVDRLHGPAGQAGLPEPLDINGINASFFLELTERQRFWDIESLSMRVGDLRAGNITLSGQVYNDTRYLEFNGFTLQMGDSELRVSGEIDGVDLYAGEVGRQLREARYDISLGSPNLMMDDFRQLSSAIPEVQEAFDFSLHAEGTIDSMWVDEFRFGMGESYLTADAFVENLAGPAPLGYRASLLNLVLRRSDVEILAGRLAQPHYRLLENLRVDGSVNGTSDSVSVDLQLNSGLYGSLSLAGGSRIAPPYRYAFSLDGTGVDAAPLLGHEEDSTDMNFTSRMTGVGFDPESAVSEITAAISDSRLYGVPVGSLTLEASLIGGMLEHSYSYRTEPQLVEGRGTVDFTSGETVFSMQGKARHLDLRRLLPGSGVSSTDLSLNYNAEFQGDDVDRLQGRANLDIALSTVGGDTLAPHQFYVDLNSPGAERRSLRLTSSFLDLNLNGTIVPSQIAAETRFWAARLEEQVRDELLLHGAGPAAGRPPAPVDSTAAGLANAQPASSPGTGAGSPSAAPSGNPQHSLSLDGTLQVKNLDLLRAYFPAFPELRTDASIEFNANTNGPGLLFSSTIDADTLSFGNLRMRSGNLQITANFRSDRSLREYSTVEMQTLIGQVNTGVLDLDSVATRFSARRDSLRFSQEVGSIAEEASMDMELSASYADTLLRMTVERFRLGNENYAWRSEGLPRLEYGSAGEIDFHDFVFRNRDEFFRVNGAMSDDPGHALEYTIRNVNLDRISGLVDGKFSFAGMLSGDLVTRSLTRQPSIQGELRVDRFTLTDRLIGDVRFQSRLNEEARRFDTRVEILTDSTRYGEYLEGNDQVGQNIVLDGWFVAPDLDAQQDTVYYFDARFPEIDLWVLSHIVNPLNRVEGKGTGEGYLTGNLEDFDFHADFRIEDVYVRTQFLETEYYASGPVAFDKEEGVTLDSLRLRDTQGGTGMLWGNIDLNEFRPISYLDLTLELNGLRFLDNSYDPDIPFYGTVAGTGRARLSGSNTNLLLRTDNPIRVTPDSRITIPLLAETELSESGSFIRFVDTFEGWESERVELGREAITPGLDDQALEEAIQNLTFNERFNLDLRFNAPDGVNVELIFDQVTGEVLKAQGTGQMRLTMQDEEVQMFGRYDITGGTYQFVTSGVISKQLRLDPGGNIAWQGDPGNAQLNISAVYYARPDVSNLNYRGAGTPPGGLDDESGRRVPVELVVEITGTVSSVSNNYYFRLPNSLDLSSNSTLSYTINQINRDEQQKLLQATSILLTDRFIPVQSTDQATTSLSQSLTRSSTVLNPLLSNQVISPLLSNQINSLLNSDVSRFDIDFNLNSYNEIDLGIALRLYNDRLILRREGQITGETSFGDRIGDLNATYRIRRGLSLTAFHRQDQVFGTAATGSQASDVTPSVDGIGLEAEVQFNSWQELKRRVANFFRGIFGGRDDDEEENENEEIAEGS